MSGEIRALPQGGINGAQGFLAEASANGARGIIIATINGEGGADVRCYGDVRGFEMTWVAAVLVNHAVNGPCEDIP